MADPAGSIKDRHSESGAGDLARRPPDADVQAITEAARWAPTAPNMRDSEVIVVDEW